MILYRTYGKRIEKRGPIKITKKGAKMILK